MFIAARMNIMFSRMRTTYVDTCVMMASNVNKQLSLSPSKVRKAREAFDFLSSSVGPSGLCNVFTYWNAFTFTAIGISEETLGMLKCMKAASKKS